MDNKSFKERIPEIVINVTEYLQQQSRLMTVLVGSLFIIIVMIWLFSGTNDTDNANAQEMALPIPTLSQTDHEEQQQAEENPKKEELVSNENQLPPPNLTNTPIKPAPKSPDKQTQFVSGKWHTITVKKGDTLTGIFNRLHLSYNDVQRVINQPTAKRLLHHLSRNDKLNILVGPGNSFEQLTYKPQIDQLLVVKKIGDNIDAKLTKLHLEKRQAYSHGVIQQSLFTASKKNGISLPLIFELVRIFQWDIDFARDIRPGDSFSILFEEEYLDGERVGTGHVLAAEFTNQKRTYRAIRYTNKKGLSGYYTPQGRSLKRQFIRTPVKFTRISSTYSVHRWHPILHRFRTHAGVDYAAPKGTPIKVTANGRITFRGRKGGYGNAIIVQHGTKYSTLYGHMSRFNRKFHKGSKVKQGDVIGYVGMTGLATGPHLHYEFRVKGKHKNPLTAKLPQGNPIPKSQKAIFRARAHKLMAQLALHQQVEVASN